MQPQVDRGARSMNADPTGPPNTRTGTASQRASDGAVASEISPEVHIENVEISERLRNAIGRFWPLSATGPLHPFFDPEFIYSCMFVIGPGVWGIPTANIRRPLKNLAKSVGYRASVRIDNDVVQRDRELAYWACNEVKCRNRIGDLEFERERPSPRYGRVRVGYLRPAANFSELIYHLAFLSDSTFEPTTEWFQRISVTRPDTPKRHYLSSASFKDLAAVRGPPTDPNSIDYARIIMLFAGLVPETEALDVLVAAVNFGCSCLLPPVTVYDEPPNSISTPLDQGELAPDEDSVQTTALPVVMNPETPRLNKYERVQGEPSDGFASRATPIPDNLHAKVQSAWQLREKLNAAASGTLAGPAFDLAKSDERELKKALDLISNVRDAESAWRSIVSVTKRWISERLTEASSHFDVGFENISYPDNTAEELTIALEQVAKVVGTASQFDRSQFEMREWAAALDPNCKLSVLSNQVEQLAALFALAEQKRSAATAFAEESRNFLASNDATDSGLTWLRDLELAEVEALFRAVDLRSPLPKAFIGRLGVERGAGKWTAVLLDQLAQPEFDCRSRRSLIYFLNPAASSFDREPALRRVFALERFRDILTFETPASLTDPSSGLGDPDLVGTPLFSLIRVVCGHLELVQSTADLNAICSTVDLPRDDGADLIRFSRTPSTLSGLFHRLRERARTHYFSPMVKRGSIDIEEARNLISTLDVDEVINAVAAATENALDRIEPRHKLQLRRYLEEGITLVQSYLANRPDAGDGRQAEFKAELRARYREFSSDLAAVFGSIQWLEREVGAILRGEGERPNNPTLRGGVESCVGRAWQPDDTRWAQEYLDLPLFYSSRSPVLTEEVALAALVCWAKGQVPSPSGIVDSLLHVRDFKGAIGAANNAAGLTGALLKHISKEFQTQADPLKEKIRTLASTHGKELIESRSFYREAMNAFTGYDIDDAIENIELLEIEVDEEVSSRKSQNDSPANERRTTLIRLLLLAEVGGIDGSTQLSELEARWKNELERRAGQLVHLKRVGNALRQAGVRLPELTPDLQHFEQESLRADHWLSESRSSEFAYYLDGITARLTGWIESAPAFSDASRAALVSIVRWLIRLVNEQTNLIRNLSTDESGDSIFEHTIEVCSPVEQSGDPKAALEALLELGEQPDRVSTTEDTERGGQARYQVQTADMSALRSAIQAKNWDAVIIACDRVQSGTVSAGQTDDTLRFVEFMQCLETGSRPEISVLLAAARAVGTAGHVVQRCLTRQQALAAIAKMIWIAADGCEQASTHVPPDNDSWGAAFSRPQDFLKGLLQDDGTAARLVEQLASGTLGGEVVERLWDAVTNTPEPGASRRYLLQFLEARGFSEHVVSLAARYDPAIKQRVQQLLEVRALLTGRPDLLGVAQALTDQTASKAKATFRDFLRALPAASKADQAELRLRYDDEVVIRDSEGYEVHVTLAVEPFGIVPSKVEATLFPEDDIDFGDGSRRTILSNEPIYATAEWPITLRLGPSWRRELERKFRIRIQARTVTDELIVKDADFRIISGHNSTVTSGRIDDDTLFEAYPGITNTPALGPTFHGRIDELEKLRSTLVGAQQPSPVLLTGMRRVGKTSLLLAFHAKYRQLGSGRQDSVSVYLSLAERRAQLMDPTRDVSTVFFSAIAHALGKLHFTKDDHNRELAMKISERLGSLRSVREAIQQCRDPESISDSLTFLSERISDWCDGHVCRVIFLVDEAESLVLPYQAGGSKRIELEQLLQGLREMSQTTPKVGIVLAGSNHISAFAREYKNAFFGSCVQIELGGIKDPTTAALFIAPPRTRPFLAFQPSAIELAVETSSGMPQFMWQIGAAAAAAVRSGIVTRGDIRRGVSAIASSNGSALPFKPYDVLEPVEHMLGLQSARERDLSWLLLWRVAAASSLVAPVAQQQFIVDQQLLELEGDQKLWTERLLSLVDLKVLEMPRTASYQFCVPLFGEGFRAKRQAEMYLVRYQRVSV